MSARELELGIGTLRFARLMTDRLLDHIPDESWYHIPLRGGNHAAWIAGHVAWEDDDCLKGLIPGRGNRLSTSWIEMFQTGTKAVADASAYPPIAELRAALNDMRAEFISFFEQNPDRLHERTPESLHGFAKDLSAFMHAVACHEMIHVGHLTVVRKSLNLKPVFM